MTIYKEMKYQMRLPGYETLAEGKDGEYEWKALKQHDIELDLKDKQ